MSVLLLSAAMALALAAAAFCAGTETGLLSVSRGRVLHMARQGGVRAKVVLGALSDLSRTMTALLVGNNLAAVSYSSASAALSTVVFAGEPAAQAAWGAGAAFAMLCLGEFLPKLFLSARPLSRMLALAPVWRIVARVLVPVGSVVQSAISRFLPRREQDPSLTPDAVLRVLEDRKDGVKLSDFESALIGRLMVLRKRGEFVTPDSLLAALDGDPEDEP
ncbi:MAG: DUF21 domain-containing protein [Kiritimatiellae bacterium]|nr:DUF21 domain-containing protein [Kiritimatiellia bacterium]